MYSYCRRQRAEATEVAAHVKCFRPTRRFLSPARSADLLCDVRSLRMSAALSPCRSVVSVECPVCSPLAAATLARAAACSRDPCACSMFLRSPRFCSGESLPHLVPSRHTVHGIARRFGRARHARCRHRLLFNLSHCCPSLPAKLDRVSPIFEFS